jgi:hypothetical protein
MRSNKARIAVVVLSCMAAPIGAQVAASRASPYGRPSAACGMAEEIHRFFLRYRDAAATMIAAG